MRPRGAAAPVSRPGSRCVMVLMLMTVCAKWNTGKVQFYDYSVVRFGSGAAAAAGPRQRSAAAFPAGDRPARGHPEPQAARRRAAAVLPGAGPRAGRVPGTGAGVLQPAALRGLPDQPG